jgi:tetratricopeptide (TPR) repeat protein
LNIPNRPGDLHNIHSIELVQAVYAIAWSLFFLSLAVLADMKHVRYKLIGMELSLLVLFVLWFWVYMDYMKNLLKDTVILPYVLFCAVYTVMYYFSGNRLAAYAQWQRVCFSCMGFFLAYMTFPRKNKILMINFMVIIGGLIALYGILQKFGGVWRIQVPRMGRVFSTFGNPNFFASFLVGLIPVSFASFAERKKIWKVIFIVLMLIALYYTYSRGAWLGLFGIAIFWWFVRVKKNRIKSIVVLLLCILVFGFFTRKQWMRHTHRLIIWRDTLVMAVKNPVTGVGLGQYHSEVPSHASNELLKALPQGQFIVNYAHNEFLEVLAETGIIGMGLYLWILAVFYISAFRKHRVDNITLGAVSGVTGLLIQSGVSVSIRFAVASVWLFIIMGIALRPDEDPPQLKFMFDWRLIPVLVLSAAMIYSGKKVVEPLVSHKKLVKEVDFFDRSQEYSEESLNKEIGRNPQKALAYYKLGWEQAKKKRFAEAIENFNKAISLDGSMVGAYNNLGNIYYTIGQPAQAMKYYKEALRRNPSLIDAHFNLGYIYYHQGRLKEATREFEIVLELDPGNYKAKIMIEKMVQ